jgi:hypothetical protein
MTKKKETINDLLADITGTTEFENFGDAQDNADIQDFKYDTDFDEKVKSYNNRLNIIDPHYAALKPRGYQVLVRVKCFEAEQEKGGLIRPPRTIVQIPTQSGHGSIGSMESPFPFSPLGVVVAVGNHVTDLKPRMIVSLSPKVVVARVTGSGDNADMSMPFAFVHPNMDVKEMPTDPDNKHYGYLLVDASDIPLIVHAADDSAE